MRSRRASHYQVAEYISRQVGKRKIDHRHPDANPLNQCQTAGAVVLQDRHITTTPIADQHVIVAVRVVVGHR